MAITDVVLSSGQHTDVDDAIQQGLDADGLRVDDDGNIVDDNNELFGTEDDLLHEQLLVGFIVMGEGFSDLGLSDESHAKDIYDALNQLLDSFESPESGAGRGGKRTGFTEHKSAVLNAERRVESAVDRAMNAIARSSGGSSAVADWAGGVQDFSHLGRGDSKGRRGGNRRDVDKNGRTRAQRVLRVWRVVRHIPGVPG